MKAVTLSPILDEHLRVDEHSGKETFAFVASRDQFASSERSDRFYCTAR